MITFCSKFHMFLYDSNNTFSSFFSVNYHVALRVCFSSKHQLRMPNVGLIACVTRENE